MLPVGLMYDFIDGELNGEKIMLDVALEPVIRQRREELKDLADRIVSMRERQANEKLAEMEASLDTIKAKDPYAATEPQMEILQRTITKGRGECKKNTDALEESGKTLIEKNRQQHARMAELQQLRHILKVTSRDSQFGTFLKQANDRICDHVGRSNASK